VVIVGSHLGVDCDAINDRVTQLEIQQRSRVAAKRFVDDFCKQPSSDHKRPATDLCGVGGRPTLVELTRSVSDAKRQLAAKELREELERKSDDHTRLGWEVDSEKFEQTVAHLYTARDVSPRMPTAQNAEETSKRRFGSPSSEKQVGYAQANVPLSHSRDTEKITSAGANEGNTENITSDGASEGDTEMIASDGRSSETKSTVSTEIIRR
jgi:crotonobetainyl-CoA:carnitine CoA-transferase CaiB-like acyl-CoA transferase